MSSSITSLAAFIAEIDRAQARADELIPAATTADAVESARVQLVGRTSGIVTVLSSALSTLPREDRPEAGRRFNAWRVSTEAALDAARAKLAAATGAQRLADPTMPGRRTWRGARHPVSVVIDEIEAIFRELGFTVALGPEAEHDWYNFGALNFPADHPAMDMHDTLYLGEGRLLRTHTSPVQVRTLQTYAPPIRILAPGNVYRRDFFDATHAPVFSQLEGLAVDEGISFADLKAMLSLFARKFYGTGTRTRFGPSYFPFTEPSAQMEVEIDLGDGRGTRWLEIMGCGLVHPAVLESAGLDSERYSGWAFGMGPGRIAMSRYGINDIRLLYDSDMRFLEQFAAC
ncbi:MAG TPA: phenylalanine--tRNA ligase subunit alpha [Gemmatimonadaceae bacterium]|nr:phenylalanine--tRNA ligase subunit alpha [Gemmatimonadaceae bacterium]